MRDHRTHVRRPSPSIAVAPLALFVVLGGGAYASPALTGSAGSRRACRQLRTGALEPFEEDRLLEALLAPRPTRVTA
jgi:hypothetical protein